MKSPKLMTMITLIMISVMLLSSCAPKATQAEPTQAEVVEEATQPAVEEPTAAPAEKVTITLYYTPDEGSQSSCWNDASFAPFNDQSDTVILESVPQMDAWNTTRTALAGGAGPDPAPVVPRRRPQGIE
jgi:hypothetical protein